MTEKETHELMNATVDDLDDISQSLFAYTNGDLLITAVVASKTHGQMIAFGPLDNRGAIGLMLTVIAGAGEQLGVMGAKEKLLLSEIANNLIDAP